MKKKEKKNSFPLFLEINLPDLARNDRATIYSPSLFFCTLLEGKQGEAEETWKYVPRLPDLLTPLPFPLFSPVA